MALAEGLGGRRRRAESKYLDCILDASEEFSIPFPLIFAVIRTESDFREDAVSEAGATGLMQLMPDTFLFIGEELLSDSADVTDIAKPEINIRYGTAYLAYLMRRFENPETALAAYNAGERRVSEWLENPEYAKDGILIQIPFPETENYVTKVTRYYKSYCQKYHTERRMMMKNAKELSNDLFYAKKSVYEKADQTVVDAAYAFAKPYAAFLDAAKTEREAVNESIRIASEAGFQPYTFGMALKAGGKYYYNNRGKNLFLFTIGKETVENGIRISAAHIDSPRLDLKQCPLYEEGGMSFFKTHYYGGIRKYQWVATPMALHGVIVKKDGTELEISVGEDENDPIFYINDLLPHLGHEADKKPLGEAIPGEKLNVLIGSRPYDNSGEKDLIKLNTMALLHEKYGICEDDFLSAELTVVPAFKARDIGFDRSLVGAYGHDDRVCAYPALRAILDAADSEHTLMCILADKEEIGSEGDTGMQCELMLDLIDAISASLGGNPAVVRANSKCLSADVSAAYDPNFPDVFEKRNTPLLSAGVVLTKFTGARGKSGTNDASAEYIGWLRRVMENAGVVWQAGELGKVDCGGGGTVAKYISKHNIETVDLGVPVISMHAPYEVIAKVDLYEAYRAFVAFCRA